jgi:hypothetical protein
MISHLFNQIDKSVLRDTSAPRFLDRGVCVECLFLRTPSRVCHGPGTLRDRKAWKKWKSSKRGRGGRQHLPESLLLPSEKKSEAIVVEGPLVQGSRTRHMTLVSRDCCRRACVVHRCAACNWRRHCMSQIVHTRKPPVGFPCSHGVL